MDYLFVFFVTAVIGFLATEYLLRSRGKRKVNIAIVSKDGKKRVVQVNAGKDSEYDALITKIKKEQRARRS